MPIGDIMVARRVELGWTQTQLAQRAGVDARQIRRYEAGDAQPTIAVAQSIAKALRITLDELAGEAPGWNGLWWTSWDGFGLERVRGPIDLSHRGHTVEIRLAGIRDHTLESEPLRCDGNLLAQPDSLAGWFDLHHGDLSARGTLTLARRGESVSGDWVRLSIRQKWSTGRVGLGRTPEEAETALEDALKPDQPR